jgi:hypothetical protein
MSYKYYKVVRESFWTDTKVVDDFNKEDCYFFLYLLTSQYTNSLGVFHCSKKSISFETKLNEKEIDESIKRLEEHGVIKVSKETGEIVIMNYMRHGIVLGGKSIFSKLNNDFKTVKDRTLIPIIFKHLEKYSDMVDTVKNFIKECKEENPELFLEQKKTAEPVNSVAYNKKVAESLQSVQPESKDFNPHVFSTRQEDYNKTYTFEQVQDYLLARVQWNRNEVGYAFQHLLNRNANGSNWQVFLDEYITEQEALFKCN